MKAEEIFKMEYGDSKNFMTPYLIEYGEISDKLVYELSEGEGIDRKALYGITVVELKSDGQTVRRFDLSESFKDIKKARRYIEDLRDSFSEEP